MRIDVPVRMAEEGDEVLIGCIAVRLYAFSSAYRRRAVSEARATALFWRGRVLGSLTAHAPLPVGRTLLFAVTWTPAISAVLRHSNLVYGCMRSVLDVVCICLSPGARPIASEVWMRLASSYTMANPSLPPALCCLTKFRQRLSRAHPFPGFFARKHVVARSLPGRAPFV
ncbi:hypothetical protein P171DRAFT_510935 [Karstenula rhodostoma CBS 690.94]|uniref:Uncharacterized protein n=1 Tax=Karstenula rhodostoma CBS 690.94 TaxID=1392251 RepID=A0A9P4PQ24_9PLEO|nr:hypothetical protein P171DRAFT_510935 [Karstenula rhodostoma CBS 690.94]